MNATELHGSTDIIYQQRNSPAVEAYREPIDPYSKIPQDLKPASNWVMYRLESRPGREKPTKVPYQPNGALAKANDKTTWSSYQDCLQALDKDFSGIGFEFTPPYIGVDLDHCRDVATGKLQDWASDIVSHLDSYTELSPSGTGVHIIVKGKLPPGRRRLGPVEMYDHGRYFTMTGQHVEGTPLTVEDRTEVLSDIHEALFAPDHVAAPPEPQNSTILTLTDQELIQK